MGDTSKATPHRPDDAKRQRDTSGRTSHALSPQFLEGYPALSPSPTALALDLDSLGKEYGGRWAVEGLSLHVAPGEFVALLGPSGCGKTTTLRMIAGLIAPDAGDVRFDNESVRAVPPERRGAVMVFQQPTLFAHMDVAANVGFGLKMRRLPRAIVAERVRAALAQVQLTGYERRTPGQLSGGQQQRVALARALVTAPRALLLDEPLSSLDPSLRDEMRDLIAHIHAREGITTVLVTHDRTEAMTLASRIAFLSDGRLQQYGPPPDLYERPATAAVARFFGMTNLLPAEIADGVAWTAVGNLRLTPPPPLHRPDPRITEESSGDGGGKNYSALLGIRPEHIALGEGPNRVTGRVSNRTYLGLHQQITLDCDGTMLTILAPADASLATGETVVVSLPPDHLHLLPTTNAVAVSIVL